MDPISCAAPAMSADTEREIDLSPFVRQEGRRPARMPGAGYGSAAANYKRRPRLLLPPVTERGISGTGKTLLLTWLMQRIRPAG